MKAVGYIRVSTDEQAREGISLEAQQEAEKLGANAVVGMRFITSFVMGGAAELLVYGTAVVVG